MTTIKEAKDQAKEYRAKLLARAELEAAIVAELPDTLPMPTIANETPDSAWLSFRRSYGETWNSADLLAALEQAGFKAVPATLAKYGNYRRTVKPGFQHQIPETSSHSELVDSEPIAPLWVVPNQYTGVEAIAFYRGPSGRVYRVSVPGPTGVHLQARRVEFRGGWRYERGTAKMLYPASWHNVYASEEATESIAQVCVHSRAYVDTEQGISGAIYFTPFLDQGEFPLIPSQFLRRLEAQQD